VAGRIHDVGQNVLQSSFSTGSSSSPNYCYIFFLAALLEEDTIRNIIILHINYKVMCINNKNSVINNNNDGRLQDLILLFTIPMGT
jgi:hypothetical protein